MSTFSTVEMLQGYLRVLGDRQQMVATNMANADTPGYHTHDINFQSAMRQVMDNGNDAELHEVAFQPLDLPERPDGNNVNIDRESMLLSQTQLQYQLGVQLVKSELKTIMTAIKEGS